MVSSVHLMTAGAIAESTDNWFLILVGPVVIHFLIDLIPHWNPDPKVWPVWKYASAAIADFVLSCLIIFWLVGWHIQLKLLIAMGMGVLPDIIAIIGYIRPNRAFNAYNKWHNNLQTHVFSFFGFASQILVLLISGYIIWRK